MLESFRQRLARAIAPSQVRRFDAAAGGRRASGFGAFGRTSSEVSAAAYQVRSRARYLAANTPHVSNAVANWVASLVGTGIPMTDRLLAHCRRWRRMGANWAVGVDGQRIGDVKHAFQGARKEAGLPDVSPHILKHTAITWAMQKGLTVEDAADYFDTSAETIRSTYYHHSPHYQDRALMILNRKL